MQVNEVARPTRSVKSHTRASIQWPVARSLRSSYVPARTFLPGDASTRQNSRSAGVLRSRFRCFHHSRLITQWSSTPSTVYSLPRQTNLVGLPSRTQTSTGSPYVLLTWLPLSLLSVNHPGEGRQQY